MGHFAQFGTVVDCKLRTDQSTAFVTFNRHLAALHALESPEAVCGNRFIKLEWARKQMTPEDPDAEDPAAPGSVPAQAPGKGGKGRGGKGGKGTKGGRGSAKGSGGEETKPVATATAPKSKSEQARELVQKQQALAAKQIEHQKQIVSKIMAMPSLTSKEKSEMIKRMISDMDANRYEMQKGGNLLKEEEARREEARKAKEEADSADAKAAEEKAAAEASAAPVEENTPMGSPGKEEDEILRLQSELKALEDKTGIPAGGAGELDPEHSPAEAGSAKGGKAGGKSGGKGKGKGKGNKGGKGSKGGNGAMRSLDLRPKTIEVTDLPEELVADPTQLAASLQVGNDGIADLTGSGAGKTQITFGERWQAEAAMKLLTDEGKYAAVWSQPAKAPAVEAPEEQGEGGDEAAGEEFSEPAVGDLVGDEDDDIAYQEEAE